jgi:hypothetical protein
MDEKQDEERPQVPRQGGCFWRLVRGGLILALIAGLAAFLWLVFTPQDLSDVATGPAADLTGQLAKARREGGEVDLSEAQLNGFIAATLDARQAGSLEGAVTLRRVVVRLEDGFAEVVIEREILGFPQTVSMYLRVVQDAQDEGAVEVSLEAGELIEGLGVPVGGRFGKLRIPQGFLRMVLGSYVPLTSVYAPELRLLGLEAAGRSSGQLPRIVISEDRLRIAYRGR